MFRTKPFFTVFGGSYVPERHSDHYRFDVDPQARSPGLSFAAGWVVSCSLLAGISVLAAEIAYLTTVANRLF